MTGTTDDGGRAARSWALLTTLMMSAAAILAVIVIAQAAFCVLRFRDVFPFGDMVDVVYRYFAGPAKDFWIYHDNEHLPLFAMPLFWIDFNLFRAQGSFLIGCNLVLAAAIALAPAPAMFRSMPGRPLGTAALGIIMLALYFWLGNYVNLIWTKQVHMYLSEFAVMLAIGAASSARPRHARHVAWIVACLVVATFSFGYGIIGFPVILVLGLMRRWRWRWLAAIAAAFLACAAVYFAISAPFLSHRGRVAWAYRRDGEFVLYAFTFLASPLVDMLRTFMPRMAAFWIAWCLTGLGAGMFGWHIFQHRKTPPTPLSAWAIGMCLFAILVAAETASARSIFGYDQATDGRYVVGQLPFWTGLLLIGTQYGATASRRAQAATACTFVLVCAGLLVSQANLIQPMRVHSHDRWSSAMSAIDNVADPAVYVRDDLFYVPRVPAMIDGLRARHWSAYAWPQAAWIGRPLASFGAIRTGCVGEIDSIVPVGRDAGWRAEGWAADSRRALRSAWILLTDSAGIVRGLAHSGGAREDVQAAMHAPGLLYAGWTGYVPFTVAADDVTAYLLLKDEYPCRIGRPARFGS